MVGRQANNIKWCLNILYIFISYLLLNLIKSSYGLLSPIHLHHKSGKEFFVNQTNKQTNKHWCVYVCLFLGFLVLGSTSGKSLSRWLFSCKCVSTQEGEWVGLQVQFFHPWGWTPFLTNPKSGLRGSSKVQFFHPWIKGGEENRWRIEWCIIQFRWVSWMMHKERPIFSFYIWSSLSRQNIFQASYAIEEFLQCARFVFLQRRMKIHSDAWKYCPFIRPDNGSPLGSFVFFGPSAGATILLVGPQSMEDQPRGLPLFYTISIDSSWPESIMISLGVLVLDAFCTHE